MLLKRITGETLAEAVEKTRSVCGEDALLVDTKKTRNGYLIVAAKADRPKRSSESRSAAAWTRGFAPVAEKAAAFGLSRPILHAVEKTLIGTKVELGKPGDPALPLTSARVLKSLLHTTELALPQQRVLALVGPTGVGKTTTLAKLAAEAVRERGESVAILTVDTYRVAAVEQLRAFAEMLDVPFTVAFTPSDLRQAVRQHACIDRIFVDTSGRSPFDKKAIQTLQSMLRPASASCVLCLCAHARRLDLMATLPAFAPVEIDSTIITKWD